MIPIKPEGVTWTDEQWQAIYLTGKNIIVSAGAGSGKTAVLTERIIEKIKSGISIDDMIILTFTNAAAAEMRERVRDKIVKAAALDPNLKEQLYLIDQAPITTFDAYSLSLVKKYHYLLGIGSNIGIIDNVVLAVAKEEMLDSIIDKYYDNDNFIKLLDTYTNKDDATIRKAIISIYNKTDSICKRKDYLDNYMDKYYNLSFIKDKVNDYLKLISDTRDVIMMLIESIKNIVSNEELTAKIISIEENLDNLNYAKKYDDYKKTIELFRFPTIKKTKKIDQKDIDEIKGYLDKLKKYTDDLRDLVNYESLQEIENEILSTNDYALAIVNILKELDEKIFSFKKEKNAYEFSDITRLAIALLEDHPEIRDSIKSKTNEIMIDEYQDTNDIGDYFISLISNNNVYMVGDVKQSIYRFRNANPKIFMEKYHNYKNGIGGYALDLNKNFRSREEVLSSINLMFNHIMDEEIGGANYQDGHNMIYGNKTYSTTGNTEQNYNMEIYNYDYKISENKGKYSKDEIEAFIIVDDIINKVENKYQIFDVKSKTFHDASYKDFVILVDKKTKFDLFKKIFDYKGIPIIIHKDEEFVYSSEIYVLKNILKLINIIKKRDYTELNYAFASVARSYLFKYSDNDIFTSITNKDILTNPIFSKLFDSINKLVNLSKKESISNLILDVYKEFDFYSKSINIGNVDNVNKKLDYIVDVSTNLEEMGYSLDNFITYFDNVFDKKLDIQFSNKKDTSSNSVNIMTIHKSKGLEYPICYFPLLYSNFNKADLNDRFIFSSEYGIVMPIFKEGLTSTIYKRLLSDNYLKEDIAERLRVLYVALTRAKEKIIMINPINESDDVLLPYQNDVVNNLERQKYSNFGMVLASIKPMLAKYITSVSYDVDKRYERIKEVNYKDVLQIFNFHYDTEILNLEKIKIEEKVFSHTSMEIESSKETSSGLNVHEVLEYLDFNNYMEDLTNYEISDFIKSKIVNLFNMPFMENINICKTYKEYEFYTEDSHGIIDLLIEKENKFIIVDYKLKDISKSYYTDQVKGYMDYIKSITNKEVEGYIYSILDSEYKKIRA